ncbi:biotin-dependent carboxyltransferase family protein [Bacillus sp. FJAT-49732]|uniref:Biotin-dependent carboxyltransferase family protein n=1 Tax=Lederbergia citrisecunda TaxID=2833583 RepID=A0A942TTL9_9BACI|nr:biotin-dependent carboxyltransferase family protein [Lederbergia citrisecunda]MBS4201997.1 biotin-dependent carboxyltransferase family protein [Lederbergia citrisecunda]
MALKIIKNGAFTTIQDLGRNGWQAYGVPVGGAMDRVAARLVNILLGNYENEAVLEMTLVGPTIRFDENTIIAFFGANMSPKLNGKAIEPRKPIHVSKGDIVTFGRAQTGVRTYLGVKDGFSLLDILGSKSTNARAKMGRPLQTGDVIPINQSYSFKRFSWGLSFKFGTYIHDKQPPIRFVKGRQYDLFTTEAKQAFLESNFIVSPNSDRMGYRLAGPKLSTKENFELITEGTTYGSIQVPPNGEPIILMADRQPTGGYPKIGEIISSDLPRLSQIRPGEHIHFKEISLKEAQQLLLAQQKDLAIIKAACLIKWRNFQHV